MVWRCQGMNRQKVGNSYLLFQSSIIIESYRVDEDKDVFDYGYHLSVLFTAVGERIGLTTFTHMLRMR